MADPMAIIRMPVAKGSRVPLCPTFGFILRLLDISWRTWYITSCDVMPAGLSTMRTPEMFFVFFCM